MNINYCPHCGTNLSEHPGATYCFQCGARLATTGGYQRKSTFADVGGMADTFSQKYNSFGIIYTDLNALAETFRTNKFLIKNLINKYIERLKTISHQYILLDVSSEHHFSDQTTLSASDPWQMHVDLINDTIHTLNKPAAYLFIIGGHNIIPMPVIPNEPGIYPADSDIDTDMPYAYLIGDGFEQQLWDGSLFNHEIKLHVGRLPLPEDGSIQDLSNFLNRSATAMTAGFEFSSLFGLSAYSWRLASEEIIRHTTCNKAVFTSPENNLHSIDNIFNHAANLFFFNLHGTSAPDNPYYLGDSFRQIEERSEPLEEPRVIGPHMMAKTIKTNMVVSEACYGARFIDFDRNSSMLLSALTSQTVTFVGSSRVSFGAASANIFCADVIARSFIESIQKGLNCGMALSKARIDVVSASPDEHFYVKLTTAVEFNLFGDPVFTARSFWNKHQQKAPPGLKTPDIRAAHISNSRPRIKMIYMASAKNDILRDVRESVNQEIMLIRNTLNSYLYKHFQIEEKDLNTIFSLRSGLGEESYNFIFMKDRQFTKQLISVFTDTRGNIKSVLTSK